MTTIEPINHNIANMWDSPCPLTVSEWFCEYNWRYSSCQPCEHWLNFDDVKMVTPVPIDLATVDRWLMNRCRIYPNAQTDSWIRRGKDKKAVNIYIILRLPAELRKKRNRQSYHFPWHITDCVGSICLTFPTTKYIVANVPVRNEQARLSVSL